ncbi:hypothetical protein ABRT01_09750 [Lentibacillus sp. L22]|uniref:hypothetical protein n=1 Tax=Lentibacillus sp. L22 TaxID=3163028 RepID=UPI0034675909
MDLSHMQGTPSVHRTETIPVLKQEQIIQGKVLQLYPNNKAQIQLQSQSMVAQLEAPLTAGKTYYFQIGKKDDLIRLKVLKNKVNGQEQNDTIDLLQQFGLKAIKPNKAFLGSLLNKKIPFDIEQRTRPKNITFYQWIANRFSARVSRFHNVQLMRLMM